MQEQIAEPSSGCDCSETAEALRSCFPVDVPPPLSVSLRQRLAPYRHDLALLTVVLIWGINFAVLKAALVEVHPHVLNIFRFAVSALVLGGLFARRVDYDVAAFLQPLRDQFYTIVGLGLLGYLFYQLFFILGVAHTTAGSAALIMAGAPLWTALFGHVFGFDRMVPAGWLGLGFTLVGTAVIVFGGTDEVAFGSDVFLGNALMVMAALLWGAYTAFNKPATQRADPIGLTFWGVMVAFPFLVAIGLPYAAAGEGLVISGWVWAAIIFSGGLSTGWAFAVWNTAVHKVGPSQTAIYGNLVPVVALLSGLLMLGEPIWPLQLAGGALIIGGLILTRWARHTREAAAAVPSTEPLASSDAPRDQP